MPPSAFVVSLDFELHWGVRDLVRPDGPYGAALHGAREAVPGMLERFARHGVGATWATVGMLFARSADDRLRFDPALRPAYVNPALDAYAEPVGAGEADDPLHFASSLVQQIVATPRQELATHTYAHVYCLEAGQTPEAFDADLGAAQAIAQATTGRSTTSLVLPRNQVAPPCLDVARRHGITAVRGAARGWMYRPAPHGEGGPAPRLARLLDAFVPLTGAQGVAWDELQGASGLVNVRASLFLRPLSGRAALDRLHERRVLGAMTHAARTGRLFHLWWHPHNFGRDVTGSLARLDRLLGHFDRLRREHGMASLTMAEVAALARA